MAKSNLNSQNYSMQWGDVLKFVPLRWKVKFYLPLSTDLANPEEEMTLGLRVRSCFFLSEFF